MYKCQAVYGGVEGPAGGNAIATVSVRLSGGGEGEGEGEGDS